MNKRTDEYGARTFENRCRFARELLAAVREAVGPGMAMEYRMSGDEFTEGGVGIDEAVLFAKTVQDQIDLVHISAGNLYNPASLVWAMQPAYLPMATNVRLAERIKKELRIPVTSVGSFNLELAEEALAAGKADMIAMIRQFIADPDCVEKARCGRDGEIRPCIRCMVCTGDDPHGCPKPLRCTVNPVMGRHPLFDNIPESNPHKKVAVIGGGAAGLEAARRCAGRGNKVVLFEKEPELGGTLLAAGANILKGDVRRYYEWSVRMTKATPGIDVRTGAEATRELVLAEKPDAVIVAVGSDPIVPDIPGLKAAGGGLSANVCLAADVDLGRISVGKRVVLIGAGLTGTETAVALARDGREVTLIDTLSLEEIDSRGGAARSVTAVLRALARDAGVTVITGLPAREITPDAVIAEDASGAPVRLVCDSVVLSMGLRPRAALADAFKDCAADVFFAGDCARASGNITSAVLDGFYAAMNI
jgi:NADPH-dependent 2,4-dienoyl-CoA reductase/sulfur reductase-like enzyme